MTHRKKNKAKDDEAEKNPVKAKIFTELMYRHWDAWRGEKRSHLFLFDLKANKITDLTPASKFDVPTIALGGDKDYGFSYDAKDVFFTANKSEVIATSTNNDIYYIALNDPNLTQRKISLSEGNDNQPLSSPDGNYIAFRSMSRAGFEADKQSLVLYDTRSKRLINPFGNIDLSVGEMKWTPDSRYIYFTAANTINECIYRINIENNKIELVVEANMNSNILISKTGDFMYYKQMKSTQPNELFSFDLTTGKSVQITHINKPILDNIEWNEIETFMSVGAEGAKIQSILVKPPFFDENKKYPMIFLIHTADHRELGQMISIIAGIYKCLLQKDMLLLR